MLILPPAMAGGLGVLFGKDPLNLALEDQISFAAQVIVNHFHDSDDDEDDCDPLIPRP